MSRALEQAVKNWLERKRMITIGTAGHSELGPLEEKIKTAYTHLSKRPLDNYDLDELSVANLKNNRFTRNAVSLAVIRAKLNPDFVLDETGFSEVMSSTSDMILAEVLNDLIVNARNGDDADEPTEKKRRVYYQNIVYQVCNVLDMIQGKHVRGGEGVVCGTLEAPSERVQTCMMALFHKVDAMKSDLASLKECFRFDLKCPVCYQDNAEGRIPSFMYDEVINALKMARDELKGDRTKGDWSDTVKHVDKILGTKH
jgi:hypothetical protein